MFISLRVIFGKFLRNLGFHVRGVSGVGPDPPKSATSDFDEIYTIYVNFAEEHNGLSPDFLGGHLRGGSNPISNFEKKLFGCNDVAQEGQHQSNETFQGGFIQPP